MANFDPLQNRYPLTDRQKTVTVDYVGEPYVCAKFGPRTASVPLGEICRRLNKLFIPLFSGSHLQPARETRRQIVALDGSNDADSRKGVPFGDYLTLLLIIYGVKPLKTPFWGRK